MKNIILFIITSLLCSRVAHAEIVTHRNIPNADHPKTFLESIARLDTTKALSDVTAYNIAGEVAAKNLRFGGTLGWILSENQRIKMSAEFLLQNITYGFFSGNADVWVQQSALGLAYQYDFAENRYHPQFDLSGYVSYAPNRNLDAISGTYMNSQGQTLSFTDVRSIAGSHAEGIAPAISFMPWRDGKIKTVLYYDRVRYDTQDASQKNPIGFGGGIELKQALTDRLALDLSVAVRQPFNNYNAMVSWSDASPSASWSMGLFGGYTAGKHALPSTYEIGVRFGYFPDRRGIDSASENNGTDLLTWTARPAVHMPQVLAMVDKGKASLCPGAPIVNASIPLYTTYGGDDSIETASAFSGNNLTYSLSVVVPEYYSNSARFSIDPSTGVVSIYTILSGTSYLTVTATNSCGSVSTQFEVYSRSD